MIIYKITNKINGKIYIGLTTRTMKERIDEHRWDYKKKVNHLYNAMRKYGIENFEWIEIDKCKNIEELQKREEYWIKHYKSNNKKYGYNILDGGPKSLNRFINKTLEGQEKIKFKDNLCRKFQGRKSTKKTKKTSIFMGVQGKSNRWVGGTKIRGKRYYQTFETEIDAAIAYDKMIIYFYDDGLLNFPENLKKYRETNWGQFWESINSRKYIKGGKPAKIRCKCGNLMCAYYTKKCAKCDYLERKDRQKGRIYKECNFSKEYLHWLIWNIPTYKIKFLVGVCKQTLDKWLLKYDIIKRPNRGYWRKMLTGRITDYQI